MMPIATRRLSLAIGVALSFLTILRAVFIFLPVPQFWGINLLQFFPVEWGVALSAICAGVILWANKDTQLPEDSRPPKINIYSRTSLIVIVLCAGAIFVLCAVPVALLGDGPLFLGDLYRYIKLQVPVPLYREPLTMLLNSRVYQLIKWLHVSNKMIDTYKITGAFFGMLFVATALRITSTLRLTYTIRVLAFVLLLSCGGTLFFFGYVENYAPQYALVLMYSGFVLDMLRCKGSVVRPAVMLGVCCLFHAQNVLLIPSLAVAVGMRNALRRGTERQFAVRVYQGAAIAVPVLLLVYAYFQWKPIAPLERGENPFIPFSAVRGMRYTLLSPMHLADIVLEHLLLAPVAIVLLIALLITLKKSIRLTSPEIVCVAIAAMGLEAFLLGGYFTIGLSRDWDVVAAVGPMLTLVLLLVLEQVSGVVAIPKRMAIATGVVALAGVFTWIAVNVDDGVAMTRYATLLEYHRPAVKATVTRYGYDNLRKIYYERKDWGNAMATGATMLEVASWHFDLSLLCSVAEQHVAELGDTASATIAHELTYLNEHVNDSTLKSEVAGDDAEVRIAPTGQYPVSLQDLMVGDAVELYGLYHRWSLDEAIAFGDSAIRRHPDLPLGYELQGWLHLLTGDTISARKSLRAAVNRDSRRVHPMVQLALCYESPVTYDSVRAICKEALMLDPMNYDAVALMFSAISLQDLKLSDTTDLVAVTHAAEVCLASAKDRKFVPEQVGALQSIIRDGTQALQNLRATHDLAHVGLINP